ncbi:MAG: DNA helicase RecQ [Methylococcaceae bacterium]|nr:MAG: DNA helicase RecQ [Methylococcaceae bacterium]
MTPQATDPALNLLQRVYGYQQFRGHQADVIRHVTAGGDALVLMPTGGGKSVCYQIPSLLRPGCGVVVSPLIALMQDQVNALQQLGVRSAFLNSTLNGEAQYAVESAFRRGELDLLYIAPERLLTPRTLDMLQQGEVALFAIDEAHCVSQWGHDFRAEYWKLSVLHERFPAVPRIALTATADARTREEILLRLGLEQAAQFVSGFDRPNIRYRIQPKQNIRQQLLSFLSPRRGEAGIVYCLSRKKTDETAAWLREQGYDAWPYHAGMTPQARQQNQDRFLRQDGVVIVATIAFGMGIDKPDVRFVAHTDLPKTLEAYYQETGRAGRDGLPSEAWMIYGLQDVVMMQQWIEQSEADDLHKQVERHKLDAMLGFCELTSCRRQALLAYFGDEMLKPCGNCDNCLEPVQTWDATEAARKALSCVYRAGQRFGVVHLLDILLGHHTEKIRSYGHDRLSTYGIGKDLDATQWRSVFRQLLVRGLLAVDWDAHGALRLTEASRPVLRGEQPVLLRKDQVVAETGKSRRGGSVPDGVEGRIFEELRALRRKLAEEQGVAPYMIFPDGVLTQMAQSRPQSTDALAKISGVGEYKLLHYGAAFLEVLRQFGPPPAAPAEAATFRQSLQLLLQGMSIAQIAQRRNLALSTVWGHVVQAVEASMLDYREITEITEAQIEAITDAWLSLPEEEQTRLKPLYELLDGKIDYHVLRCVVTGLRREALEGENND